MAPRQGGGHPVQPRPRAAIPVASPPLTPAFVPQVQGAPAPPLVQEIQVQPVLPIPAQVVPPTPELHVDQPNFVQQTSVNITPAPVVQVAHQQPVQVPRMSLVPQIVQENLTPHSSESTSSSASPTNDILRI